MSTLKAKEVIKEKGMTIEEVASNMGITKGTLSAEFNQVSLCGRFATS